MGMVNVVVPHSHLEDVALGWAAAVNEKSPMSVRMLKYVFKTWLTMGSSVSSSSPARPLAWHT